MLIMDSKRIRTMRSIAFSLFLGAFTFTESFNATIDKMTPTYLDDHSQPPYGHGHVHAHYVSSPMDSPYLYAHNHIHEHPHEHVYTTSPVVLHPITSAPSSLSLVNETTNHTNHTNHTAITAETNSATTNTNPTVPFIIHMGLSYALGCR